MLALDSTHVMYWEQCGNPNGVPVLYLHGGPGAGAGEDARQFFNPEFYRIIIFDQRGSGRSKPLGEVKDNTTPHLIADIETLRKMLDVEQWLVFGGSWGSTLALMYAESHPQPVLGLILRGIFLGRPPEIRWFLHGSGDFFNEAWKELVAAIPENERADLLTAYHKRIHSSDPAVMLPAVRAFSKYEGSCSKLLPDSALIQNFESDHIAIGLARMETHYFQNNLFMPDNFILNNIAKIRRIPGIIIQGRYDMVCPPVSAFDLKNAWPEAELQIIEGAGHSRSEQGIRHALLAATRRFEDILRPK
ncbi:MAG: prolyl aminopeptidase [Alphaproteobacteria bacterium]|nr:MAG: prolyl aminopeptidase [Alphaproteobacteria bacterium]